MRKRIAVITGVIAVIVAAAAVFGAVATKPAEAFPSKAQACSNCHGSATAGAVKATPSKTTPLAPGEAYTVNVAITFPSGGQYGTWVTNGAGTPSASAYAGPGSASTVVVPMHAPTTPGTYSYTAWGVRGTPSAGQNGNGTYQVTVQSSGGTTTDTVAPTAIARAAASVKKGKTATLKYKVTDPAPNLGTATATITIKNAKGKVVKTVVLTAKPVNTPQKATFKATLKKGKYKFYVTAVDAARNHSSNVSFKKLTVK
ncbi:MAG TPA: hypothetical protein VFD50_08935 [Thermoleophilia bacterium]|nr:hypothetical protein [Thermoleophilia bacterium]